MYTLGRFRDELKFTFHATEGIRVNTPAVRIDFGTYASETLEIVPAYFQGLILTPLGHKAYYYVPGYKGGWMPASPDAHNNYVRQQDLRLKSRLKPLIQLLKAWKYYNSADILSFYLELRVTKFAESEKYIDYADDFANILDELQRNGLASMRDPMGVSGLVHACTTEGKKSWLWQR